MKMTLVGTVQRIQGTRWDQPAEGQNKPGKISLQVNLTGGVVLKAYEGQQLYKDLNEFVRVGAEVTVEASGFKDASYMRSVMEESGGEGKIRVYQIELEDPQLLDFKEIAVSERFKDRTPATDSIDIDVRLSNKGGANKRTSGAESGTVADDSDKY